MKNKTALSFFAPLIFLSIFFMTGNQLIAQADVIHELNYKKGNNGILEKAKSEKNDNSRKEFNDLSQKLHSTFYYQNGTLKNQNGNSSPVKVTLYDLNSFSALLNNRNNDYSEVRLITATVKTPSELNSKIDLALLTGFPKLKYILINCFFDCDAADIENTIVNPSNKIRVFYCYAMPN